MARIKFALASQLIEQLADLTDNQPEKFAERIIVLQKIRDAWAADREVAFTTVPSPDTSHGKDKLTTSAQNPTNKNPAVTSQASECMQGSTQDLCISRDLEHSAHRKDQKKLVTSDIRVKDEPITPPSDLQSSQRENVTFADSAAIGSDTGGELSRKALKRQIVPTDHIHTNEKPFSCSICKKTFRISTSCRQHENTHRDNGAVPQGSQATKERVSYPPVSDADSSLKLPAAKRQQSHQMSPVVTLKVKGSTSKAGPVSDEGFQGTKAGGYISYQKRPDEKTSHSCNVDDVAYASQADLIVHQCKKCGIFFSNRVDLEHHNRTCCSVGSSSKARVGMVRPTFVSIQKKYEQIHKTKKTHTSTSYERAFPTLGDFGRHKPIHANPKPHVCDICNKSFSKASELKVHKRTHTGEKPFKCRLCEKRFSQNSHLKTHWKKIHKLEVLGCKYCRNTFLDPDKLRHHEQNYHHVMQRNPAQGDLVLDGRDGAANGSTKNVSIDDRTKHPSNAPRYMNQYPCDVCGESFQNLRGLQTHYKVHISKSQFRCEHCRECFFTKSSLSEHVTSVHGKTLQKKARIKTNHGEWQSKPVVSELHSAAQFREPTHLRPAGQSQKDQKERIYQCPQCGKKVSRKDSLVRHIKTHTKKTRHVCNKCRMTFARKYSLIMHKNMQHELCRCTTCQELFSGKAALNKHALVHRSSERQTCDVGFPVTSDSLADSESYFSDLNSRPNGSSATQKKITPNVTLVKGGKEHKCQHCGKIFPHKSRLTAHERIHTGEKPFSCDVCQKSFRTKSSLNNHRLTQHGIVLKQPNPRTAHTATVGHSTDHPIPAKLQSAASPSQIAVKTSKKNAPSGTSVRKCSHCGETFNHLGRWQEHMYECTPERNPSAKFAGRYSPPGHMQ